MIKWLSVTPVMFGTTSTVWTFQVKCLVTRRFLGCVKTANVKLGSWMCIEFHFLSYSSLSPFLLSSLFHPPLSLSFSAACLQSYYKLLYLVHTHTLSVISALTVGFSCLKLPPSGGAMSR